VKLKSNQFKILDMFYQKIDILHSFNIQIDVHHRRIFIAESLLTTP